MEISDIMNLISNVGFPVGISIALIFAMDKRDQQFSRSLEDLRKTVENNTIIITRLYDKLGERKE